MQLAIVQIAEVGLLQAPFVPSSILCWFGWVNFLLGAVIQWVLWRKARQAWARWSFGAVLVLGLGAAELGCQIITGWDLLLPLLVYWWLLTLLLGAAAAALVCCLRRRREMKAENP